MSEAASGERTPVRLVLKAGRDKSLRNRHPWVFSGALAVSGESAAPGELADLVAADGRFVARGYVNPGSQIRFRALTFRDEPVDPGFFASRLRSAIALRNELVEGSDVVRLVHSEGDGLPGLVVDRYGDFLVVQLGSAGMERNREIVLDLLEQQLAPKGIFERSQGPARREERLDERIGVARGVEPPPIVVVREADASFAVDLVHGQKTGFYVDQRDIRELVRRRARGRRVFDLFAYSGGIAVCAALGGATRVVAVESSASNLALLPQHLALNELGASAVTPVVGDAFAFLREGSDPADLIVVDPPPFARKKTDVDAAARAYKDINLRALTRLASGGLLVTSTCSHHVDWKLFQQILFASAKDAAAEVQIVGRLGQPADHPISVYHPEGEYLKTMVLRRS